jgi:hypothetical protein
MLNNHIPGYAAWERLRDSQRITSFPIIDAMAEMRRFVNELLRPAKKTGRQEES